MEVLGRAPVYYLHINFNIHQISDSAQSPEPRKIPSRQYGDVVTCR
jgi:hypothetical protein